MSSETPSVSKRLGSIEGAAGAPHGVKEPLGSAASGVFTREVLERY